MLQTLVQMDKMEALRRKLTKMGMLAGTISSYLAQIKTKESEIDNTSDMETMSESHVDAVTVDDKDDDGGPIPGSVTDVMSDIKIVAISRMSGILLACIFLLTFL